MKRVMIIALPVLFTFGCAHYHTITVLSASGNASPQESWARVLERHVNGRGQVDFRGLADDLMRRRFDRLQYAGTVSKF